MTFFDSLTEPTPDFLHQVFSAYNCDDRSEKCDLGVGVYYDEQGQSPVMDAVKKAEMRLLNDERSKSYTSLRGSESFLSGMSRLLPIEAMGTRTAVIQSVGGTGGVRLALELAFMANPALTVHVGTPTWPNHLAIPKALGIPLATHQYYDEENRKADVSSIYMAITSAQVGDVIVIHGPCHNPTGAELSVSDYTFLLNEVMSRGLIPLIDAAYFGLGNDLSEDMQFLANSLREFESAFLVMSCSKAFGLYRERTGVLFTITASVESANRAQRHLENIARRTYSMAPSHGASIVGEILESDELTRAWRQELSSMRERVRLVRAQIEAESQSHQVLSHIGSHKGIFTMLSLTQEQVSQLARDHAFYLAPNGRANLAGLRSVDVQPFCDAIAAVAPA